MENLSIVTSMPSNSEAYIFGSVLISSTPADFDLLVIYDEAQCLPSEAFATHAAFVQEINTAFGLPVHLTLLTKGEAKSIDIIERTNAILLFDALKRRVAHTTLPSCVYAAGARSNSGG